MRRHFDEIGSAANKRVFNGFLTDAVRLCSQCTAPNCHVRFYFTITAFHKSTVQKKENRSHDIYFLISTETLQRSKQDAYGKNFIGGINIKEELYPQLLHHPLYSLSGFSGTDFTLSNRRIYLYMDACPLYIHTQYM